MTADRRAGDTTRRAGNRLQPGLACQTQGFKPRLPSPTPGPSPLRPPFDDGDLPVGQIAKSRRNGTWCFPRLA
jgi:hypothetical protein